MRTRLVLNRLIFVAACAVATDSVARTWHVEKDNSGDFTTLIDALNAAAEGDSVLVGEGRFDETQEVVLGCCFPVVAYAPIFVPEITIIGAGRELTVIGPEVPAVEGLPPVGFGSVQGMPGLRIESLTIQNLVEGIVAYGELDAFDLRIENISEGGVFSDSHDTTLIASCEFLECDAAVLLHDARNVWIRDCEFVATGGNSLDFPRFNGHLPGPV